MRAGSVTDLSSNSTIHGSRKSQVDIGAECDIVQTVGKLTADDEGGGSD